MWRALIPRRSLLFLGVTVAVVRIATGLIWTSNLEWKEPPDFGCGVSETRGLCDWLRLASEHSMVQVHADFVEETVLPNYELFGYFLYLYEAITGLLLIFGLLTRVAAMMGLLQSINLFIGVSRAPGEWSWDYGMMIFLHLALLGLAAGRYFGLDVFLHQRWSESRAGWLLA